MGKGEGESRWVSVDLGEGEREKGGGVGRVKAWVSCA